jgi:hypothetical protein
MKRLATLVLMAGLSVGSVIGMGQGAAATPFVDVPSTHWAYQAIQSLAADGFIEGYSDGTFKGDRPLTRYEIAVIISRVIQRVNLNVSQTPSKADLDKLQKLIDAFKDELDSLGVRVTNVEDALDALDKRTKFAQSVQFHGVVLPNNSSRQRVTPAKSIVNTTGAPVTTYYGAGVANGRTGGIDPFVNAFLSSPSSNSPLEQAGPGELVRYDDRFTFSYAINENLTVSLPFHVLSYGYGGEFSTQNGFNFEPDVVVRVAKAGNLTNLQIRDGQLDNILSSRTGLAYRASEGGLSTGPGYENPVNPYGKGFNFTGTLNGLTQFQLTFQRLDQVLLNTNTGVSDPNGIYGTNNYLFFTVRPQTGYLQPGQAQSSAGALRSNTFTSGAGALTQVFLDRKAVTGSVYISAYNGALYNAQGQQVGGAAAALPGFLFNENLNAVVFASPLPAGSQITVTYVGLTYNNNTNYQRYDINARINHKIKGLAGAEVGLSFNRIWDDDQLYTSGDQTNVFQACNCGFTAVSDTVFGLDFQAPLPFTFSDKSAKPILFGEVAGSKYTADYRNVAATTDTAGVLGLRFKIYQVTASLQYQSVGPNFFSGAPIRYFGNAPSLFTFYRLSYYPQFFGFGNSLGVNQQFDAQFTAGNGIKAAGNPNLTFIYPLFNPFVASGPQYFSNFAPNTQGETLSVNSPIRIGDLTVNGRLNAQHLNELRANGFGAEVYGPSYYTSTRESFDKIEGGASFSVPVFSQKVAVNLTAGVEHLSRKDTTAYQYYPINPGTQSFDPAAIAAAAAYLPADPRSQFGATGGSKVPFYPNYVDMYHVTYAASAALPVTKDVSLNFDYNTQRYRGAYGTTIGQNMDERKDQYQIGATYNIPKTNSSVSTFFRQQKYTDNVLPTFNFTQNREDVNFAVRF